MGGFPCPHCLNRVPLDEESRCPACGKPLVVLDRFPVDRYLGRGGMGLVLGGPPTPETGGRPVAVKILSAIADDKTLELFERGNALLRTLDHPGLPRIFAIGEDCRGGPVLVRERLDGGSLEGRVRDGRTLTADEFRRLTTASLELLAYLQARVPPVLHRDIKPSNVMFRTADDWDPVLVDFDTVAVPGSQAGRNTIVVSLGYTAPEQLAGDPSPASDVYSLGATLLFVATHVPPDQLPREGGRFQVDRLLDSVDPVTRRVLLKMVEPDRRDRYARAEDALADLRAGEAPHVLPPAARDPDRHRERHRKRAQDRERLDRASDRCTGTGPQGSRLGPTLLLIGALLVPIGLGIGGPLTCNRWYEPNHGATERLHALLALEGPAGRAVFLEEVDSDSMPYRLTAVDMDTGRRAWRLPLPGDAAAVLGQAGDLAWMYLGDAGLAAIDLRQGRVALDQEGIDDRYPALRGQWVAGGRDRHVDDMARFDPADGAVVAMTRDGRTFRLSPGTWSLALASSLPEKARDPSPPGFRKALGCDGFEYAGRAHLAMQGRPVAHVVETDLHGARTAEALSSRVVRAELPGFLNGELLCAGEPWGNADPAGATFYAWYDASLEREAPAVLARVSPEQGVLWTRPLPELEPRDRLVALGADVFVGDERLLIVGNRRDPGMFEGEFLAIALDARTGETRWIYEF